jgi:hypothetical protein
LISSEVINKTVKYTMKLSGILSFLCWNLKTLSFVMQIEDSMWFNNQIYYILDNQISIFRQSLSRFLAWMPVHWLDLSKAEQLQTNKQTTRDAGTGGGGGRRGSCPSCLLLGGARGAEVPFEL